MSPPEPLSPLTSAADLGRLIARLLRSPLRPARVLRDAAVAPEEAVMALGFWRPRIRANPVIEREFLDALLEEWRQLDALGGDDYLN